MTASQEPIDEVESKLKKIAILGSTGSIGTQTLDVIAANPEQFEVVGLAAGNNVDRLREQVRAFRPQVVSVATRELAQLLDPDLPEGTQVYYGDQGLLEVANSPDADLVVSALVGSAGLRPTLAAIEAGKTIGLANKETLVTAGHIVTELAAKRGVRLLPVDSEHSAIFQCLNGESQQAMTRMILTASGGSFRDLGREQLGEVTVEQALRHPNWSMGAKITIDCATMMNKGFEVIEAHWLFDMPYEKIDVLIHPESVIHSMVQFQDHSMMAQLGTPDMRVPIQYALTYPERRPSRSQPLDLAAIGSLHFREVDLKRYPCLQFAYDCGRVGGTAPTVLNAANEVAVALFLQEQIAFLDIERIITHVLEHHDVIADPDLEQIEETDRWARYQAHRWTHI